MTMTLFRPTKEVANESKLDWHSQIDTEIQLTENDWAVSLLNTECFKGHSALIIEGIKNGSMFTGIYEMWALDEKKEYFTKINAYEYINGAASGELKNEQKEYREQHLKQYINNSTAKSIGVGSGQAQLLIQAIGRSQEELKEAQDKGKPGLPYSILAGKDGDNCTSWCVGVLKEAKIDLASFTCKMKPSLAVTSCIML